MLCSPVPECAVFGQPAYSCMASNCFRKNCELGVSWGVPIAFAINFNAEDYWSKLTKNAKQFANFLFTQA